MNERKEKISVRLLKNEARVLKAKWQELKTKNSELQAQYDRNQAEMDKLFAVFSQVEQDIDKIKDVTNGNDDEREGNNKPDGKQG
jgi:molecular chaperone GrpE (heat shock protein)